MGLVYKGRDVRLDRLVALKFLPEGTLSKVDFAQLENEAHAISLLNHKNIATIYELEIVDHHPFIVLEYLPGGTLKEKILREGKLSVDESIAITMQVADGLAYAHSKNITHRDIKSDNIMFSEDGTVKITDFGISKIRTETSMTTRGEIVGTMAYMSPEQVQGAHIYHRTDIWALGIIMYEMLTGHVPFRGDLRPAILFELLTQEPAPLSEIRADVPSFLNDIVTRCLNKDPAHRYQSAHEISKALESTLTVHTLQSKGHPSSVRKFWWTAAVIGVILLSYLLFPTKNQGEQTPSLAITYLKNLGPESDEAISYGITQDLIVDLARAGWIRVAPMKDILQFKDAQLSLEEIAKRLDVQNILEGSILRQDTMFKISAQLVDIKTKRTLWADHPVLKTGELSTLQSKLALPILSALKIITSSQTEKELAAKRSDNPEAYEYYLKAKYKFDNKKTKEDVAVAQGLYNKAIEIDSGMYTARLGLAETFMLGGGYNKARQIYSDALAIIQRRGERLAEASCLRGLGLLEWNLGEYDKAMKYFNDGLSISEQLGDRSGEARLLNNIGLVSQAKGNQEEALRYFENSLRIRKELNDFQGQAQAFGNIGLTHFNQFNYNLAIAYDNRALTIDRQMGDRQHEALILNNMGLVHEYQGNYVEALSTFKRSLEIKEQLGDRKGEAQTLNNVGLVYQDIGDLKAALEYYVQAESIHVQINNRKDLAISLDNKGQVYDELGEYPKGMISHLRSISLSREIGAQDNEAYELYSLGICYLLMNNTTNTRESFERSKTIFERLSDTLDAIQSAAYLVVVLTKMRLLPEARAELAHIEQLMKSHNQFHEHVAVYWNLAQVYESMGNSTTSQSFLEMAHQEIINRAEKLTDSEQRQSYFNNVRVNREVIHAWKQLNLHRP